MSPQELDDLLAAHFAGTLDAGEQKRLGDALLADESARRRFVELADQEAALRTLQAAEQQALAVGRKEAREAQRNTGAPSVPSASTPCASCASLRQSPRPPPPAPRRSGWLLPAVAAAAIIVVSGLFASGILPSGNVKIRDFDNTSGKVVVEKLSDGTRLAIAPGAVLRATGRDEARRVRQLIRLEAGEVEIRAPKAAPGETACRVETPEGLWVETVGTIFKVTRTWENEKGERNVDRSKLTGAAIAAVLLVAVSEGEVRTGRGFAEEGRVAQGGEAEVKVAEAPKAEEKISWGRAAGGLLMGLETAGVGFETGSPLEMTLHCRNIGQEEARLLQRYLSVSLSGSAWRFPLAFHPTAKTQEETVSIAPGKTVEVHLSLGEPNWRLDHPARSAPPRAIPPGRYAAVAEYATPKAGTIGTEGLWIGATLSGEVNIEILADTGIIRVGDDADEAEKRILARGGQRIIVPLAPVRDEPPPTPDGKVPADWKPRPTPAHRAYELAKGHKLIVFIEAGKISGLTEEKFPDGSKGVRSVKLPGRTAESAFGGDWLKLLDGQPAYKAKPGEEYVFKGRLDVLRPLTELGDYAYRLSTPDGSRFTLGVSITEALEQLRYAELKAGRMAEVEVRGKIEKDVRLYKGEGGTGTVLWPAVVRLAARPATETTAALSFSTKPQQPADKVVADVTGGALLLTVNSPGGIGSAEVKPEKGEWPRKIVVLLALKGLEGFTAECGGRKLTGGINGSGARIGDLASEKKGEFIEVALPEGFAAGKEAVLKLSWVDFYR